MTYYNNTLCVTKDELVKDGYITEYDYNNFTTRKKIKIERRGCRGNKALISFESLPPDIKHELSKKHVDIETKAKLEPIKKLIVNDYKAYNFFSTYTLPNGENLKPNTIREYTSTAVALNTIIKLQDDSKAWRKALGTNKRAGSLKNLVELLNLLKEQWGWKLPNSERGLRLKLSNYKNNGYASLISGKLCNDNAAKVVESQQEATLRRLLARFSNFDNVQVRDLYNMTADAAGWKRISEGTVANKRDEWQIYVDAGSRGAKHHHNTHAMQTRRRAPQAPLLYWTVDGWDVELLYQETSENKKGHINTTYHNRLTTVVVLDPCQKYPIGYAIGTHETPELIRQALRNAITHTEELFGAMHHVHQLQTDRYGRGSLKGFYEGLSEVYTPAGVGNAKAKVIEPYFKHLNKTYCQLQPNWSGFGVTARKEKQPNVEYLNKIRKSFPNQDNCIGQIVKMIETERAKKKAAYLAAYELLPQENKYIWTKAQFLNTLGEVNRKGEKALTSRLEGSGLNLQVNKEKYHYESFDQSFRKHRNLDWTIKYNPADMSEVLAVNLDGSLQFLLVDQYVQPMAIAERSEADGVERRKINQFNRDLESDILETQAKDHSEIENLFYKVPALQDTLGKLLLVDSNGQHKDHKNAARIQIKERRRLAKLEAENQQQSTAASRQAQSAYLSSKINLDDFINE